MRKIIVYRKQILRKTETFIKSQIQAYKAYKAVLYGESYMPDGMDLAGIAHAVISSKPTLFGRVAAKVRQRTGRPSRSAFLQLRSENACLMHAHTGFDGVIAWPYARLLGIPLVVTLHGQCTTTNKRDFFLGRLGFWNRLYPFQLLRLGRHRNSHFIAVSEATRETAIAFGLPRDKIKVLYSGVQPSEFPAGLTPMEERPKRVVFVARLIEFKGCSYLIEAFKTVLELVPDAELVIVGDGPMRASLEEQAARIGPSIRFAGARGKDTIVEILSEARAFCLPSITTAAGNYETFGMVAIEAQAVGVPVITSARGAKESVIDGVTGFTFNEKDVPELARLIVLLLKDPQLAGVMGQRAAQHVRQHFSTERCNALIESYYDSILSRVVSP